MSHKAKVEDKKEEKEVDITRIKIIMQYLLIKFKYKKALIRYVN